MEPKPVIALNNQEARLDAAESAEEDRVLGRLSDIVASNAATILQVRVLNPGMPADYDRTWPNQWLGKIGWLDRDVMLLRM